ncbi:hypothetical protein, partial [Mesorhizobium sp.]|uniref:hypothetical protein n=1 Tax=Mesorhizobium sp. TaxID=1871066 RepID=UPI0025EE12FF
RSVSLGFVSYRAFVLNQRFYQLNATTKRASKLWTCAPGRSVQLIDFGKEHGRNHFLGAGEGRPT